MDDPNTPHNTNDPAWERHLLDKVVMASLAEQRAKRRWGIFFKLAALGYFVAVLVLLVDWGHPE
ncbi:MAG TPA: S49 family peptidase, partial [Azospira sp.]|nr:S49 family peptidase [Azospira sp.]